jgi:hypothetical protein
MIHRRALLVALALVATSACGILDSQHDLVSVNGTVHFYTFEGGFWAVRGDDNTTYDPLGGLPMEFRQEGLRVLLRAKIRNDMGSFHMAGPIVEIITIRRL